MKPRRAVVFDLDGTLVDSMPLVLRAYAHALAPFAPALTAEKILALLGGPPERFFSSVVSNPQDAAAALERLTAYSLEHWRTIQAFEGMVALLQSLREAALAVGVWTGRDRHSTEILLREHGVAALVDACVCGDDLPSHKPDPAGLEAALRQLGVARNEAWFVGDADVDVLAGAALGVRTLLITHGREAAADLRAKAWKVVETPAEAYALLRFEIGGADDRG